MYNKLFTDHPKSVCLSYGKHFKFAMEMSGRLLIGSCQAFIHALIPGLFITSTSDLQETLKKRLDETGCRDDEV